MFPFSILEDILLYMFYAYVTTRCIKSAWIIAKSVYTHKFKKELDISHLLDTWAGGTDGIGRDYCLELARARGVKKFYLLGRNEKKLASIKDELEQKYGAEVKTAVFDFEKNDLEKLPKELETLDIGILFNCAGMAPQQVGNMVELPQGLPSKILRVNLMSSIKMLEIVLPGMVKKDRGVIINVASMTGWRPLPNLSTYPSSKAAISFFSDALSDEFAHTNVKIQCLIPMYVATKMTCFEADEANFIIVTTESFARQAVHIMGMDSIATGCWQHDFQMAFGVLVSSWLFKKLFVPIGMFVQKQRYASKNA